MIALALATRAAVAVLGLALLGCWWRERRHGDTTRR